MNPSRNCVLDIETSISPLTYHQGYSQRDLKINILKVKHDPLVSNFSIEAYQAKQKHHKTNNHLSPDVGI